MVNRLIRSIDQLLWGFIDDEFASSSDSRDETLGRDAEETHERAFHWQTQGDEGSILTARHSCNWPKCQNSRRTAPSNQRRVCIQHEGMSYLLFLRRPSLNIRTSSERREKRLCEPQNVNSMPVDINRPRHARPSQKRATLSVLQLKYASCALGMVLMQGV